MQFTIHNRDDLEKLNKLKETQLLLKQERLKEKLGKQDFHYDIEEVFEPVTNNQKKELKAINEAAEEQRLALTESVKAIREANTSNIEQYKYITEKNNKLLNQLVNSKSVDSSIIKTIANLLSDKNKSQFKIEQNDPKNPNSFTINPTNPQNITFSGSNMIFEDGRTYNLNNPDLQYFITNTSIDREINNLETISNFLFDMKYNSSEGDKKSDRYKFIKDLQSYPSSQEELEAGSIFPEIIFLPSDPNELVDRLNLLYQEIKGGNDNPQLKQEIIAIVDKLLEYQCITSDLHAALLTVWL